MDARRSIILYTVFCIWMTGRTNAADCSGAWISGEGPPGADNWVNVLKVLPNGDLIAGGRFVTVGTVSANRVARWNGSAWSALGGGVSSASGTVEVLAVAELPNGNLVIGGRFDTAGGITVNNIARWDGANWFALGTGMTGNFENKVQCLAVLSNGDLVAGGTFLSAGGTTAHFIARWNGSAWSSMDVVFSGIGRVVGYPVIDLNVLPGGDLIVAGIFEYANGVLVNNIARWNGTTYSNLGGGVTNPNPEAIRYVSTVTRLPNGDLVAGGSFSHAGGAPAPLIARWDGTVWSPMAGWLGNSVIDLAVLDNGDLIAGGNTGSSPSLPVRIARWNGTNWLALGAHPNGFVSALAVLPDGDLIVGGSFTTAGGLPFSRIARWRLTCPTGDLDSDNYVDDADQQILIAVLLDLDTNPGHVNRADANHDGNVDGRDIGPFVACRLGGCP